MNKRWPEDEIMCETSEQSKTLFSSGEFIPLALGIGRRIREVFRFQDTSQIVFSLKANAREVPRVLEGETLPSAELLLRIRKLTNVSLDWLLTGESCKFISAADFQSLAPAPTSSLEMPSANPMLKRAA